MTLATQTFHYDADGNRILTVMPDGTKIYTPFPEFEESVPTSGATTQRSHYFLAGQLIAARVKVGAAGSVLYYAYADHLGNVAAWTNASGVLVSGSLARYDPYGVYRTKPPSTVNPDISDRGFTGHRMNNTGTNDLGLVYMNARYYLPEIGRFISADSIVPDPQNPQSFNRYSYVLNSPMNFVDPTGHMESDGCDLGGCNLTEIERQESVAAYGLALLWSRKEYMTDVDLLAQLMDFAALYETTTQEWANDLTFAINRTTGVFTLITALGKKQTLIFEDEGFNPVYRDGQNQIYHWWAYVNTTAQGGGTGIVLGVIGNEVHEFYDPTGVSHEPGRTGNSWEDYALAENGLAFGLELHNGSISPKTASDAMRAALEIDSRRPVVAWAMDHIPNSWLLPNIANDFYNALRARFDLP